MEILKNHWWKVLGALILLLVTYFTFSLPLAGGITSVEKQVENDQIHLRLHTYNADAKNVEWLVWLFSPDKKNVVHLKGYTAESNQVLSVFFPVPDTVNSAFYHVYAVSSIGAKMFYPNAVQFDESLVVSGYDDNNSFPKQYLVPDHYTALPFQNILYETIRNLNFHVTMWMVTMILLLFSTIYSILYLRNEKLLNDWRANYLVQTAMLFTTLGIFTGSVWAKNTWGAYWVNDPKLNGAVVGALVYIAYLILRGAVKEDDKRARLAAVYNIFAFAIYIVFIQVLPRFTDSLHPGNGGNPAFSAYDLDATLRWLFYPAIIGFTLLGAWITQLKLRLKTIEYQLADED